MALISAVADIILR